MTDLIQQHFKGLATKYAKMVVGKPGYSEADEENLKQLCDLLEAAHVTGAAQAAYFMTANDGTVACNPQNVLAAIQRVAVDLDLQVGDATIHPKPLTGDE